MTDENCKAVKEFTFKTINKFTGQIDVLNISILEKLQSSYNSYTWPSAPVLAWYLWDHRQELPGKHILELGAGTALPGILAAKCGAYVTLSDSELLPKSLEHIAEICKLNGLTSNQYQATHGSCIMERPSMFYFEQYQKWYAWTKLGNMSKEDAKNAFLDSLNKHEPDWLQRSEEQKTFLQTGFGVSIPVHPDEEDTADDNKTAFDWLKENNLERIKSCHVEDVNVRDENGMTLLHWAADRGFAEIADYILQDLGGDVDVIDDEGQTALHYAACCEHMPVVKVLLKHNASINVKDFSGLYPYQVAEDLAIRSLIYYTG